MARPGDFLAADLGVFAGDFLAADLGVLAGDFLAADLGVMAGDFLGDGVGGVTVMAGAAEQVRSLTQFYSDNFSKSGRNGRELCFPDY